MEVTQNASVITCFVVVMVSIHPLERVAKSDEIIYIDAQPELDLIPGDGVPCEEVRVAALRAAYASCKTGKAAHIKGFTSGMRKRDLELIGEAVATLLETRGITTLCWDGDDWADDSFTRVLTSVRDKLPDMQFFAFLRTAERYTRHANPSGFNGSWQATNLAGSLTVLLCDDEVGSHDRYEQLGVIALQATAAQLVIAVGGGGTLRKEFDMMCDVEGGQRVEYLLCDAVRIQDGAEDHCSLLGLDGVALHPVAGLSNKTAAGKEGMLMVGVKIMKLIGIDEKAQTVDLILFVQMEWDMGDGSEPWIEWRDCLSWDDLQPPSTHNRTVGTRTYTRRVQTAKVSFLHPLDLHDFPFDANKIEIVMVTNPMSAINLGKVRHQLFEPRRMQSKSRFHISRASEAHPAMASLQYPSCILAASLAV